MRLGVTTFGGDGGKSGIGRYIRSLLAAMAKSRGTDHIEMLTDKDERAAFVPEDTKSLDFPGILRHPVGDIAWHQLALPALSLARRYDALFLPAANRRLSVWSPVPTIGTFHDAGIFHLSSKYDRSRHFYLTKVLPRMVRSLDHVLTVSEYSKRDLVEKLGVPAERITVTPLAADRSVYHPVDRKEAAAHVLQRFNVQEPYILYVSRLEHPGKNHVRLIEAYTEAVSSHGVRHQLVLAGSDWSGAEAVHAAAERSSASRSIHFLGFVPEADLPTLYGAADGLVFPSLFEGFGLPVLEAMSCGLPVASSNAASLPEVAGSAALLFDPYDIDAMAHSIASICLDESLSARLRQRGLEWSAQFSWERAAQSTWEVIRRLAK
ncbi:MAG: glycosyltransferase family 1 protein [Myxococcota bacterium]|jgi:glycosyltransferase involved in cell wall biosynthesis|nr:glycosyltransferase family 1 protein [Myxococcota bacterium]